MSFTNALLTDTYDHTHMYTICVKTQSEYYALWHFYQLLLVGELFSLIGRVLENCLKQEEPARFKTHQRQCLSLLHLVPSFIGPGQRFSGG